MSEVTVIRRTVFFRAPGQSALAKPKDADRDEPVPNGRVPRVARLLALALRFEELVRAGVVADYAEVARLGRVSRARLTQIMNLLDLAPDIQEAILFLPASSLGTRHPQRTAAPTPRCRAGLAATAGDVGTAQTAHALAGPVATLFP